MIEAAGHLGDAAPPGQDRRWDECGIAGQPSLPPLVAEYDTGTGTGTGTEADCLRITRHACAK